MRSLRLTLACLTSLSAAKRDEAGGLSGPPLKPIALAALRTLRAQLPAEIPIIGCGGIASGADALEYAREGAAMVQLYTAFGYGGPGVAREIKDELAALLRKKGTTWAQVVREAVAEKSLKPDERLAAVEGSEYGGGVVVWQCDPMHGNTRSTPSGIKTRRFADILTELREALAAHAAAGTYLGGVHLELTGDAVTECTGGGQGLDDDDLSTNYTSFCDPRLNEKQALELAFLVADHYRQDRGHDHDHDHDHA